MQKSAGVDLSEQIVPVRETKKKRKSTLRPSLAPTETTEMALSAL